MNCRVAELREVLAVTDQYALDANEPCTHTPFYRTRLVREVGDREFELTMTLQLCGTHDRLARHDDGYRGSWVLSHV